MHPIYGLRETHLVEAHASWIGREVRDRLGRHLGRVADILVEDRSVEDAAREDGDVHGWTTRAELVVIAVGGGLLDRLWPRQTVVLPVQAVHESDGILLASTELDDVKTTLRT